MDIVEKLRAPWRKPENKPPEMAQAADEIERLRAELAEMEQAAAMHAVGLLHSFGISPADAEQVAGFKK